MTDSAMMDKMFHIIMKRMAESGQSPHYTEIATELGLSVEDGRKALHDLFALGIGGWLVPNTDLISSIAPLSNRPNQYRITVDGQQKWFAQCGFESLAVCWLFPGKVVRVDCPCLDCDLPISIEIRDGNILRVEPEGVTGYVAVPFWKWFDDLSAA